MPLPLIPSSHLTGPPEPERKYRLMELVRRAMRERRYSRRTEEAYAGWIRRYVIFSGRRHPADLDEGDVRAFLSDLAVRLRVSASTQNQAAAAIQFLYAAVLRRPLRRLEGMVPPRAPRRLPVVLSQSEVRAVIERLRGSDRLIASLLYGSGLRILECVSLRVKDVDVERREITVRGGKGDKDRRVPLAETAVADVRRALRAAHVVWLGDRRRGVRVTGADSEWAWFYLLPATRTFTDPSGAFRRHHLHGSQVQRAVHAAGVGAKVGKRVTCHAFRHSFATHLLESGTDIRTIQELMGHSDLRTTMIYAHVLNRGGLGVRSPADQL